MKTDNQDLNQDEQPSSRLASALSYLISTEQHQPELMKMVLETVLKTHPELIEVTIARYIHLLTATDLKSLAENFPRAKLFIRKYLSILRLLQKGSPLYNPALDY